MSWQDFYKTVTNPFHAAGRFYSGPGHHGVDFAVGAHGVEPSYFDGVCVLNDHSSVLGNYTVYRRDDGKFAGFGHLLVGTRRDVGDRVKPGDKVGLAAGHGDDHGSAWTGPHCHTTVSSEIHGITNGNTVDPWPSISKARAGSVAAKPAATKTVTVKSGDTLAKIAAANKTTVAKILALPQTPKITDPDIVKVGQKVRVK